MTADATLPRAAILARDLGARGSRNAVGGADPADLTPEVAAVLAAVPAWWHAQAKAAGLAGPWLNVTHAVAVPAPACVATATPDPTVEATSTGHQLGAAYVAALTPEVRARHGRHYTPLPLADRLWAMTRAALGHLTPPRRLPGLVRDPACGAGALLLPALREHLVASARTDAEMALAGLPNVLEGIDADPAAVWVASVVLAAEALPLLASVAAARRRPLPALVRAGDGLAEQATKARVVLMNPPYGRVRLTPADRDRFARVLYGHANLYGLFVAAGLDGLDDNGVLAALVPTSFTSGRYFSSLRAELSQSAPLRAATFVVERDGVFAGVLQETCLAVFTRHKAQRANIASMNGHVADVAKVKSPRGPRPWLLPRRSDDAHIAAAAATMPLTLASAGWRVSTGPLVWNRRRADLYARPAAARAPVVWAADLDGGRLHRDRGRNDTRYLRLRDDVDRAVLTLTEPAVLVQRTTAPEQARRIVGVELTEEALADWGGQVVVENHVNVLRPAAAEPLLSRGTLARLLATSVIDRLTRCVSGSVALSAYELESLPLPAAEVLASWEALTVDELERAIADAYRPAVA